MVSWLFHVVRGEPDRQSATQRCQHTTSTKCQQESTRCLLTSSIAFIGRVTASRSRGRVRERTSDFVVRFPVLTSPSPPLVSSTDQPANAGGDAGGGA